MKTKTALLPAIALLGPLLPTVFAYGPRGVAERMLYWTAYLAEEQTKLLDPSYSYTVAPDCKGSRNGRCSLDQLLMYIWRPDDAASPPETAADRPTTMDVPTGVDDKVSKSFNEFFGAIESARFNGNREVSGKADAVRLMPGLPDADYYSVLGAMGDPIQKLSDTVVARKAADSSFKITNAIKKPWTLGMDCAYLVTALRRKDTDTFRVDHFKKWFTDTNRPSGFVGDFIPEMTSMDTMMQEKNPNYLKNDPSKGKPMRSMQMPVIDFDATIAKYVHDIPDVADRLKAANTAYYAILKNGKPQNAEHDKAIKAAEKATRSCKCKRPIPADLKKRQLASPQNWGGPKAALSRALKAQKLALSFPLTV